VLRRRSTGGAQPASAEGTGWGIESRLATSATAHFVAGLGGVRYIDLDTPLLLAIPATLFVKGLLQGRQETRFLVVLLSGQNVGETGIIPEDSSA
jgi:hypothetical protein